MTLAPLVTLVQQYVFTKIEVSTSFLFRENRGHGSGRTDGHTDGQTDGVRHITRPQGVPHNNSFKDNTAVPALLTLCSPQLEVEVRLGHTDNLDKRPKHPTRCGTANKHIHRVPQKTCDYIFYNNFNNKCPITIIFGIITSKSMSHRKLVSFPTSSI